MKLSKTRLDLHREIVDFPNLITSDDELSRNIGRRCVFIHPTCPAEFDIFTICAVQRLFDGTRAYRVVGDKDEHRFGRPARPEEIRIL